MVKVTVEQAETSLTDWRTVFEQRDQRVRQARAAGLNINRIHHLSGIARSTIYDILDGKRVRTSRTTS